MMETSVSVSREEGDSATGEITASVIPAPTMESKRRRKAAWSVAIAVLVAVVLSMPVSIVGILQIATTDLCVRRIYNRAWMWVTTVSLASSAMDPWIYAMRIREFKASFKRTLCNKCNKLQLSSVVRSEVQ